MKRTIVNLLTLAALALTGAPGTALAQFQSCNFCDVQPLTPDPFDVNACETGSVVINGSGFRNTANNGCSATPVVAVRSTRPDRVIIVSFTVLSDRQIRVDYQVPCNATSGIVGIDVTIDDNAGDAIQAYACGNARMMVHERTLDVAYAEASAVAVPGGVAVTWRTLSEAGTLGFAIWGRRADGSESVHPTMLEAAGSGATYTLRDERPEAATTVAYRVVEVRDDGRPGDGTSWLPVGRTTATIGARGRALRRAR